ncbi:MAG: hypothetical protein CL982_02905, partial [Euryarchaeota archaeon]|nr:hypothetical protein [Euryarchaeota archaeon]
MQKIDSMEKGVTYPDLDIFVSVGLGNSNESIIEGWSVRKSKYNRFVITPTGYLLNIFTMLPLLTFGIPLTFFGIVLYEIMPGIIGILLLLLCLLIRRSELCIDLDKGYVIWRYVNWPRFRSWKYKLSKPFNFKIKTTRDFGSYFGYYITVMTENQEEIDLIFFSCKQNPRKEFPIIVKTLEDSLGLRKLFD